MGVCPTNRMALITAIDSWSRGRRKGFPNLAVKLPDSNYLPFYLCAAWGRGRTSFSFSTGNRVMVRLFLGIPHKNPNGIAEKAGFAQEVK